MGKLRDEDLTRYSSNAFVRAFHAVESDPKHWPMFRDQFRGRLPKTIQKYLKSFVMIWLSNCCQWSSILGWPRRSPNI